EGRDKDRKRPAFSDAEKSPKIVFTSRSIARTGPDRYAVRGTLEIRGVAREIEMPVTQTVPRMADSAWGNMRVGGEGAVRIKRTDFGILGGDFWGKKALSDEVEIEIAILGNRFNFDRFGFDSRGKPSIGAPLAEALEAGGGGAAGAAGRGAGEGKARLVHMLAGAGSRRAQPGGRGPRAARGAPGLPMRPQ